MHSYTWQTCPARSQILEPPPGELANVRDSISDGQIRSVSAFGLGHSTRGRASRGAWSDVGPPPVRPAGKLTKGAISAELLQPAELVSGSICQVAADPELAGLLANFLYSNEGAPPPPPPPPPQIHTAHTRAVLNLLH